MTNAIKFTATSTKKVITVSVAVSREPPSVSDNRFFEYIPTKNAKVNPTIGEGWGSGEVTYLHLMVQDTGCGLTEEEMQLLFKRFSQASPRTHAQYGGSGLGLYICRQLAELHGGQIGVASEAGVGSTFGFFVMARKAAPPGRVQPRRVMAHTPEFSAHLSVSQGTTPLAENLPPANVPVVPQKDVVLAFDPKDLDILVVEDNLVNQKILVQQLKKVGSSVNAANDGLEALAFLEETHYRKEGGKKLSVILMDLEMPYVLPHFPISIAYLLIVAHSIMDGLSCVTEIRKMEKEGNIREHVPVIAVTANVRDGQITTAMKSGMDDVVSKPFRIPDLLAKIEILLGATGKKKK
jgi:CheY-like chemotaxis protein